MSERFDLVIRQTRLPDGRLSDVGISEGRIAAIAPRLAACATDLDGQDRLLIPGLHDHHIHLFATAAQVQSVDLSGLTHADAIVAALRAHASAIAPGEWVRATGYDERAAGLPDRTQLDEWLPHHPLRVQDRTGALWLLNSMAIAQLGGPPWPDVVERDGAGSLTGRIWRGDEWLRSRLASQPPSLADLSKSLARWGVTAVTDASAYNGPEEAGLFAAAIRKGELRQRLTLMGREDLPESAHYRRGALKLLFDERDLPDLASIAQRIAIARVQGRAVAAHCVTDGELAVYLAALEQAGGARPGDRIEHGSLIPAGLIESIAAMGLTLVANPCFIARRGDRYLAEMPAGELPDLHRLRSLAHAGISIRAGSDAPYGPLNPWIAIRSAMVRRTASGVDLGAEEALTPQAALALFASDVAIRPGICADLCLIAEDWCDQLREDADPNPVHLTLVGGKAG